MGLTTLPKASWHSLPPGQVVELLEADPDQGLPTDQAHERLGAFGANRLPEEERESPFRRFLKQFHNVLIYVLLVAAGFTALLQEWIDTWVILAVVVVNAIIGFIQEGKAEEAMEGIRKLLSLEAQVIRDGQRSTIPAEELVPGDVVRLESGDRVPADLRILTARNARAEEAALTGESEPVSKTADPVDESALIGDRVSMVFSGTLLTSGRITGVVVATGETTQIGRIGAMVARVKGVSTPLLRKIDQLGKQLSIGIIGLSGVVFLVGWLVRGLPPSEVFMAVVALAVAAIPEGLPAILTITLALGVQRMARRNAIIRRLPAVETLGSVTVICTDKTGTLTRNEMSVEHVILQEDEWEVTGSGFLPHGEFLLEGREADPLSDPVLASLLRVGLLCNEAEFTRAAGGEGAGGEGRIRGRGGDGAAERQEGGPGEEEGMGEAHGGERVLQGDPTEGALLVLAEKAGMDRGEEEHRFPQVDIIPFESERRWMATLHRTPEGGHRLLLKGAPERVLEMCASVRVGEEETVDLDREAWARRLEGVASEGHRLLALAERPADAPATELTSDQVGTEAVLLGVVALMDPPRPEAVEAVGRCRDAGIRVMMITGDHAMTARSIGARMGIGDGSSALAGSEIQEATDEELAGRLRDEDVVARASPEHKLRIVRLLQEAGEICAMTGDGVNDAPALKQADIGVAMGIKGSEAAKSASEMVLADDNFASIERAVEEGRTVFDNLKKTILFILPTNGAEALIVLAAVVFAFPHLPISPVQILWVNMVTAVTLALALAFEPGEKGIMARPPRNPGDPILSRYLLRRIAYVSALVASACILLFQWELARGMTEEYARTAVVNALVAAELWYLFNCRFLWRPSIGWAALVGNRAVLAAAGVLVVLQAGFTYLPFFHLTFGTAPLGAATWVPVLSVGLVLYLVVETEKGLGRRRLRREAAGAERRRG